MAGWRAVVRGSGDGLRQHVQDDMQVLAPPSIICTPGQVVTCSTSRATLGQAGVLVQPPHSHRLHGPLCPLHFGNRLLHVLPCAGRQGGGHGDTPNRGGEGGQEQGQGTQAADQHAMEGRGVPLAGQLAPPRSNWGPPPQLCLQLCNFATVGAFCECSDCSTSCSLRLRAASSQSLLEASLQTLHRPRAPPQPSAAPAPQPRQRRPLPCSSSPANARGAPARRRPPPARPQTLPATDRRLQTATTSLQHGCPKSPTVPLPAAALRRWTGGLTLLWGAVTPRCCLPPPPPPPLVAG